VHCRALGLRQASRISHAGFGGEPPGGDGVDKSLVVAFVLVGVRARELGDGLVEDVGAAKVGGDGDPVAGAGVGAGQRLMQASSDIFLGWQHTEAGLDERPRDFYVRQLRDWKFSLDIETMIPAGMRMYGTACGWTLARAHARSGDRIAIAAYLGNSDVFDRAITEFAAAYADQNERDYEALVEAVASGRITAERGL